MNGHPSVFQMDACAARAIDDRERAEIQAHVAGCTRCRADDAARRADRERFASHVFARTVGAVSIPRRRSAVPRWTFVLAPLAAAAVAVTLFFGLRAAPARITVKGGPAMQVFARHGDSVFTVGGTTRLAARDAIRFVVEPAGRRWLIIASLDGAGKVSVYYPYGGATSTRLPDGDRVELPGSIVLDDTAGSERLAAVFSDTPVDAAAVGAALRGQAGFPGDAVLLTFEKAP